ncbi:hypothetical protein BJ741DRAFT_599605 [Chytriomyces cf. hyalinus JEL632]|nr:hypothetical protein BJ741DRAFT_599605 [Chytriomyces cf. hyalinus JEL632]
MSNTSTTAANGTNNAGATAPDLSFGNFQAALGFNGILSIIVLLAFVLVRGHFPSTYASRLFMVPKKLLPPDLTAGLLRIFVSDADLLEKCGHDAFAAIFYSKTLAILFTAIGVPALIILLPINATGGNGLAGLNLLGMGNVADERKLWAHFLFAVYAIALTLYAIFRIINESVRLRVLYQRGVDLAQRTLMVRDVPEDWRDEKTITDIFNSITADGVEDVIIPAVVPSSHGRISKAHLVARNKLEAAVSVYFSRIARQSKQGSNPNDESASSNHASTEDSTAKLRPSHKVPMITGSKVDSITEHAKQFQETQKKLAALQANDGLARVSTVFVVFREPFQAHLVSRSIVHSTPWVMGHKLPGVYPEDIIWSNANVTYFHREWRFLMTQLIIFAMIIFWGAIVALVLTLTELGRLQEMLPFLRSYLEMYPQIAKLVSGILPPVIVSVLLSLVPPILRALSAFGGSPLQSFTEQQVLSTYFGFQLINVFAVNIVGASILTSFNEIKDKPSSVLEILAKSIPQSANFFIQFLLVRGLTAPSLELIQASRLIVGPIMMWLTGKTPRSIFVARTPPAFMYAESVAGHGLTVTIGLVYCILSPIVLVFVVAYFWLYTTVYTYMMQYVYRTKRSTGGKFLFTAANHMFVGVFLMEFMIFAIFVLSQNIPIAVLMILVVAVTMWSYSQAKRFMGIIETIPVASLAGKDTSDTGGIHFSAKWTAFLFPSVANAQIARGIALEESTHVDIEVGGDGVITRLRSAAQAYSNPEFGNLNLKVWIPKCSIGTVTADVAGEIAGDCRTVEPSQVVCFGAGLDAKGGVVISSGNYSEMEKL